MSLENKLTRAVGRLHDEIGHDATLVNQQAETDANGDIVRDEYNDPTWQAEDRTDAVVELVYRGDPAFSRRADGIDADIDVLVFVADSTLTFTDGTDSEARKATRVEVGGETYVVRDTHPTNDGRFVGHGSKED